MKRYMKRYMKEELMGDYTKDYVFLPILDGPDGTHNVTIRTGGGINSGQLNITKACKSPAPASSA